MDPFGTTKMKDLRRMPPFPRSRLARQSATKRDTFWGACDYFDGLLLKPVRNPSRNLTSKRDGSAHSDANVCQREFR